MQAALVLLVIAIAIAIGIFVMVHIRTVIKMRRERLAPHRLERQENILIPQRSARKLLHLLSEDETEILWLARRHWLTAWQVLVFASASVLAFVLTLVAAVSTAAFTVPAVGNSPQRHVALTYLWVLPAAIAVITALVAWTLWLKWSAEYRMLTNKRLVLITQPWEWAFWLWSSEKSDPLPLQAVTTVETMSTYWGRICDYCSIVVKSLLQDSEDEEFHEITYTGHGRQFRDAIDHAVKENKVQLVAVGPTIVPVEEPEGR